MSGKSKGTILVAPDGGWGWVVLISAVLVNLLIPGTVKSFGVLFVEFLEVFKGSPSAASWMPALCYFLYSSLGPLSSVLSMKYSYKTVTIIGGTFAASGMMISYFATSVPYLYVSYGIMVGIGAGLTCPVTVFIVTEYFQKYRGFANGICISGSCFGAMILPPLLQYLLDTVGYRGAVLIMGSIILNSLFCGLLFHPVEQHMKRILVTDDKFGVDNKSFTLEEPTNVIELDLQCTKSTLQSGPIEQHMKRIPVTEDEFGVDNESFILEEPTSIRELNLQPNKSTFQSLPIFENSEQVFQSEDLILQTEDPILQTKSNSTITPPEQYQKLSSAEDLISKNQIAISKDKMNPKNKEHGGHKPKNTKCPAKKKKFFDLSILVDPMYLVILISNSTSAISDSNFLIFLPSYAIDEGFDKNSAALLLSIVSALDLIGRIGGASLSDIDFIPKHDYFVGGLGMSGIALTLFPMATSYMMLSFFCGLHGISSGTHIGVTTVVLADMLGAERLSSSYAISLFVNGILQLFAPPMIGIIYGRIETYKPIFLALGINIILGTSIWAIFPVVKRRRSEEVEVN